MKIKKFIPRSLYGRFSLIIIISALVVQLVSIYVFYYTHLDVVSKHMARGLVEEMLFVKKSINKPGYQDLITEFSNNTGLKFSFKKKQHLSRKKIGDSNWRHSKFYGFINPVIDPYNRFKSELETHELTPYQIFENAADDNIIIVKVETKNGVLSYDVPVKRIASSSAYVFTFWMVFTALLMSTIAILFFRNQVRFIRKLSIVAEKFGRGQNVANLKPSGSEEIRSLTISFIKMQERVIRQISQRTEMLSGVSHDLRTPLTRMRLQLELMGDKEEITELKNDISDMEKLIDEYLNFARLDDKEKPITVGAKDFLQSQIVSYYAKMHKKIESNINLQNNFEIPLKKLALKRALKNLIDNAFNYGTKVKLSSQIIDNNLEIIIDDNGPGIPENERSNVFKPFYRVDNSRNLDKKPYVNPSSGGSGLGLAIAMDSVTSHGGRIELSDSTLGGLCVTIYIPF